MSTSPASPVSFVGSLNADDGTLATDDFLRELDAQNATALARIDQGSTAGDAPSELTIAKLLMLALKNELEATECAAAWFATTTDLDVKLALARQAGDESKHFTMIQARLRELGVDAPPPPPVSANASPMLQYLFALEGTVARIAAGQFTREALAVVRNDAFIKLCEARGDDTTAALYRNTIQPDERHHHELGRKLLRKLATTRAAQDEARAASERVLSMAEELQEIARLKMGITCAPGC